MEGKINRRIGSYLTINEVAARMRVARQTVHLWVKMGKISYIRIGGTVRIPREAVDYRQGSMIGRSEDLDNRQERSA